jgi:hypothetical protein
MGDKSKTFIGADAAKKYAEYVAKNPAPPTRVQALLAIRRIAERDPSEDALTVYRHFGLSDRDLPAAPVCVEHTVTVDVAEVLVEQAYAAAIWRGPYAFLMNHPQAEWALYHRFVTALEDIEADRRVPRGAHVAARASRLARRIADAAPRDRDLVRAYHEAVLRSLDEEEADDGGG